MEESTHSRCDAIIQDMNKLQTRALFVNLRFLLTIPLAGMAELADAADSKSAGPQIRGGSTPPPGTI
jgi:hypothetical protein